MFDIRVDARRHSRWRTKHHLSKDSQDVVRLGVGLIATIAALVLGLLIAAAKSSFDKQSTPGQRRTCQLPASHSHMLRHACGCALANAGHDTRALQDYLGHKNIQHTVRYTELAPTRFKDFWR
jgi:integrase